MLFKMWWWRRRRRKSFTHRYRSSVMALTMEWWVLHGRGWKDYPRFHVHIIVPALLNTSLSMVCMAHAGPKGVS